MVRRGAVVDVVAMRGVQMVWKLLVSWGVMTKCVVSRTSASAIDVVIDAIIVVIVVGVEMAWLRPG